MDRIKPKNFGVIIRTVAENKSTADLEADLSNLLEKWRTLHANLKGAQPPKRVLGELNTTNSILRDLLKGNFTNIHVNDETMALQMKDYISEIAPGREKIVRHYDNRIGIFERFGINKQIKTLFGKKVPLASGGYLIIEHTEAMHVIDVNSGNRKGADGQESNALATNIEAAEEVARVLQLRDMGGIICVDFIDMAKGEHRRELYEKLKELMASDRARHKILPPSKFGLVEITRQRVRPAQAIETKEENPDALIDAPITLIDALQHKFEQITAGRKQKGKADTIYLHVHPFLAAYLKQGWFWQTLEYKWTRIAGQKLKVVSRDAFKMLEYRFADAEGKKIG
jgi:ribonuclease G